MARPTVHDVARVAGVSLATVDRVLNERPGVRASTIARVHEAIDEIGYVRDVAAANLARRRNYAFAFVLPEPSNAFLRSIHQAVADAKPAAIVDRTTLRICAPPSDDPHAIARAVAALEEEGVDGVAIMAAESPQVRDAMRRLNERGAATVAMISDLPSTERAHFVGVDNVAAGRTAGLLLGRFLNGVSGKIVAVSGSMMARDHLERRLGFDQVIGARFPCLEPLPSLEGRNDPETVRYLFKAAFRNHSDVVGVYSFGGGEGGLLSALRELGAARDVVVVAHELTPEARDALLNDEFDAVITQDVSHVVRSAIRVLRATCDGREIVASQERIRIEVMLRENLS